MPSPHGASDEMLKSTRTKRTIILIAVTSVFPLITACAAFFFYRRRFDGEFSRLQGDWGAFGDFMGGMINPVAGLVTIVLLVLTLRSQQDELSQQRTQIERQAFEQTFFTWLTGYRQAVENLVFTDTNERFTGILALQKIITGQKPIDNATAVYRGHWLLDPLRVSAEDVKQNRARIVSDTTDWWQSVYREHEVQLGSLVRTLYTLIRWIDSRSNNLLSIEEKWDYVAIVRARLSSPELVMLHFNGYIIKGYPFREFVEKYALLDNLPTDKHGYIVMATISETAPFAPEAFESDEARAKLGIVKPRSGSSDTTS
ncbi:putative phage abortive infection protein [Achromobacter xylosoxidans]|uniref:putative phage abortive infection protein n=1 Tax=Alcaligenes xylosoxydans xylosoxydans TaxID=85698 RepID=UPI001EEB8FD4